MGSLGLWDGQTVRGYKKGCGRHMGGTTGELQWVTVYNRGEPSVHSTATITLLPAPDSRPRRLLSEISNERSGGLMGGPHGRPSHQRLLDA